MTVYKLLLLPGDGIGPEVMAEVECVVAWVNARGGARIETETDLVGGCAYERHGEAISDATMGRALAADAVMPAPSVAPDGTASPMSSAPKPGCRACARISRSSPIFAQRSATRRLPTPPR